MISWAQRSKFLSQMMPDRRSSGCIRQILHVRLTAGIVTLVHSLVGAGLGGRNIPSSRQEGSEILAE